MTPSSPGSRRRSRGRHGRHDDAEVLNGGQRGQQLFRCHGLSLGHFDRIGATMGQCLLGFLSKHVQTCLISLTGNP